MAQTMDVTGSITFPPPQPAVWTWNRGGSKTLPLKARFILSMICFLGINATLGLSAYARQRQLVAFTRDVYDRAFVGLTHIDNARMAFLHLVAVHLGTPDPSADRSLQAELAGVLSEMDLVIDRAASDRVRERGLAVRAGLVTLRGLSNAAAVPAIMEDILKEFAGLVRETSREALTARDRVEDFAAEGEMFTLASIVAGAGIVLMTGVLLNRAILQRQSSVARINHMSRHDGLTGLLNRTAMRDALREAEKRAGRGENFALLCIDLDRFKQVNDTLGHPVGDALLCAVAERLDGLTREVDAVGRLGGDEFAIVRTAIGTPNDAALLARRVVDALRAPFDVAGHRVVIGATVGIAIGAPGSSDPATLTRNADLALYRAKQDGRGVFRFFEPAMEALARARRQLEADLRLALERAEFQLHYQPLVSVRTRRVASFEALVRWNHPVRGQVNPDDFIPLTEEIGLIAPLGRWVLRTACREAAGWPEPVGVAVNISAHQFANAEILDEVRAALAESGLPPSRLELEITETALLSDSAGTLESLHALRRMGVRISMDDFGTGYSSLSYLRSFPFDKLKIDRSFIRDLGDTEESVAIVRAIVGMGRSLGIATTAEGVETVQQMQKLIGDGCTEMQGFLFSPPCPASEVPRLLNDLTAQQAA